MKKFHGHFGLILIFLVLIIQGISGQPLLTRAEASNYTETSRSGDVIDFLNSLQMLSHKLKITSIGHSTEGRDIWLVILGDPVPSTPTQMILSKKAAVYIQANIHAGEVEGKEAMLMLMRDILLGQYRHLLDHLVLLIVPNLNPDGNERINPQNRRNQLGPEGGVGVRHNGQLLDLNRDYVKLETPENLSAVQQILNRWDPLLLLDLHTTNGSYHQEPLTYDTAHNPNGNPMPVNYLRQQLFPWVAQQLKSRYRILSVPYGDFVDNSDPNKGWETFDHLPYYSTNYWGLRHRFAILNENYAYADYRTRIHACYHFVELVLEYANNHLPEMQELIRQVDANTIAYGTSEDSARIFGTKIQPFAMPQPILVQSYEFENFRDDQGRLRVQKTDRLKNYEVPYLADFRIMESVRFPKAYIFPGNLKEIAAKLQQHGILVEQFSAPETLLVQAFKVEEVRADERIFQGHRLTRVRGHYLVTQKEFSAGTYFVGMDQPLANLAAYLLEPASDCGLVVWNFLDRYLYTSQWSRELNQIPIFKLLQPILLARTAVNPGLN
ncbi:MAG: M14 family metallopeptidase [candidate division KSB1 bacterium]|nr:M14 family metallopeptidase [candidate division KSB1 bacterium]MDZ7341506.1 M14 family metallopeptidase [candidate division KSB1 bacterium]